MEQIGNAFRTYLKHVWDTLETLSELFRKPFGAQLENVTCLKHTWDTLNGATERAKAFFVNIYCLGNWPLEARESGWLGGLGERARRPTTTNQLKNWS